MNIHSGVFRPRLISRKIDEETRTFLPEETPPHTPHTRTSHSLGMLAEWPKFISQKKGKEEREKSYLEKHGTVRSSNWMCKQGFTSAYLEAITHVYQKERKKKKKYNYLIESAGRYYSTGSSWRYII